ncbi:permease prefix domain 1-containing protein [Cytobacillus sp. IB215665]|uniref:permease prefix domain 1-containing protein n=1 Tax=Cytobacillus sp. IB215665 TaxID=3097357 RepID=UPI002A0FFF98|nr:permease prefix domain 1-containing protein [Cytobacillus sp. IB215665]MDX8365552.1 permease prefix domain 1-containing protein [Cytobacillus sp. IB215665]
MSELTQYVNTLLNEIDCPTEDKEDIRDEMIDHLSLLKRDYLVKGYSDKEAVQQSIHDFGKEQYIGKQMNKAISSSNATIDTVIKTTTSKFQIDNLKLRKWWLVSIFVQLLLFVSYLLAEWGILFSSPLIDRAANHQFYDWFTSPYYKLIPSIIYGSVIVMLIAGYIKQNKLFMTLGLPFYCAILVLQCSIWWVPFDSPTLFDIIFQLLLTITIFIISITLLRSYISNFKKTSNN